MIRAHVFTEAPFDSVNDLRIRVEDARDSRLKIYFLAMEYKRISKKTFKIVEVKPYNNRSVSRVSNVLTESVQSSCR